MSILADSVTRGTSADPSDPRYARQTVLPMIGPAGQARLAAARVLVIGAGGLGCPILSYLAAAGVGLIRIVDPDQVDRSNLQRQVLYTEADEGAPKAIAAADHLSRLNSGICIEPVVKRFDRNTALALAEDVELIIDGTDSFAPKYLANDVALRLQVPFIYGSVLGTEGQVALVPPRGGPCYRCLYPQPPAGHVPNCAEAGVIGALAGMVGTIQATEAIKLLADPEARHARTIMGQVLVIEARFGLQIQSLRLPVRPACPACQVEGGPDIEQLHPPPPPEVGVEGLADLAPYRLVDVRSEEEYRAGHIPGALLWPLSALIDDLAAGSAPFAEGERVIAYCATGVRSDRAAQALRQAGVAAWTMTGGMAAWERAGGT